MKKIFFTVALSILTLFAVATKPHTDHIKVDTKTSTIKWIGSKIAESHEGTINIQKGVLDINHGVLVGGQISIDMSTITNTDMEGRRKQRLEWHLKNEDFFNVASFSFAVITISNAKRGEGNTYNIIADLTIKNIRHSISFVANVDIKGLDYLATAKIKIDRTKWDIKYNSGNFFKDLGDKLILDEVEFDISLKSEKP